MSDIAYKIKYEGLRLALCKAEEGHKESQEIVVRTIASKKEQLKSLGARSGEAWEEFKKLLDEERGKKTPIGSSIDEANQIFEAAINFSKKHDKIDPTIMSGLIYKYIDLVHSLSIDKK